MHAIAFVSWSGKDKHLFLFGERNLTGRNNGYIVSYLPIAQFLGCSLWCFLKFMYLCGKKAIYSKMTLFGVILPEKRTIS